jgi:hypothetical protein
MSLDCVLADKPKRYADCENRLRKKFKFFPQSFNDFKRLLARLQMQILERGAGSPVEITWQTGDASVRCAKISLPRRVLRTNSSCQLP